MPFNGCRYLLVKVRLWSKKLFRLLNQYGLIEILISFGSKEPPVSTPILSRRKKVPRRFEVGEATPEYPTTAQDHYRRQYFEVFDFIITAKERFQQKGFQMLQKLEAVLIKKDVNEVISELITFYSNDLNKGRLKTQLNSVMV